jgi:hypothetical protein
MANISTMTPWLLSPVIDLTWLGWRTNTYQMNQYGWDWVVEQNEYDMTFTIYAKHERDNLKAISDPIDVRMMELKCKNQYRPEKIGPVEMRIVKAIEVSTEFIAKPVSMLPMDITEESVRHQMISFESIDNYFVTEKWLRDRITEENRRKISLQPKTMKRRLDIPNGH